MTTYYFDNVPMWILGVNAFDDIYSALSYYPVSAENVQFEWRDNITLMSERLGITFTNPLSSSEETIVNDWIDSSVAGIDPENAGSYFDHYENTSYAVAESIIKRMYSQMLSKEDQAAWLDVMEPLISAIRLNMYGVALVRVLAISPITGVLEATELTSIRNMLQQMMCLPLT